MLFSRLLFWNLGRVPRHHQAIISAVISEQYQIGDFFKVDFDTA